MSKILPIIQYGNPVLRKVCRPIPAVNDEIRDLAFNMIHTMAIAKGIGLAAPQVGEDLMLMVISNLDPAASSMKMDGGAVPLGEWFPMMIANPVVTTFGETDLYREGCLSIPNTFGPVIRPVSCNVAGHNAAGEEFRFEASGLLARVIQHEYDHLLGIMFFDRMVTEARAKLADRIKSHHETHRPKVDLSALQR